MYGHVGVIGITTVDFTWLYWTALLYVDKWLEGSKPFQMVHRVNLPRKTATNIVNQFIHTGRPYTEFCKRQRSSMYTTEIQKQLFKN